jgi:lysophospholipase L1-like esterase
VRRLALMLSAVVAVLFVAPATAQAALQLPTSMASAGDSITRGFDATALGCLLTDCPQYSWSTGSSTAVNSQLRRIRAAGGNPAAYNDARTGAMMVDLDGQMLAAAGATQHADYVTVLMGANDLCTSSIGAMTPTPTFQAQFQKALGDYFAAQPNGRVFVSSIPNLYQLWSLLHTNRSATTTWRTFGICQSMLAAGNTEAQRQAVVAQEQADNAALAAVCAAFANCKWDGYATYNYTFTMSDVSTVDYFHPSVSGQNVLAGITTTAVLRTS